MAENSGAVRIRPARVDDAGVIAPLLGELGYPAGAQEVRGRLERLVGRPSGGVLMGEVDGQRVGVAAYEIVDLLERARPQCRITTLVVQVGSRQRGVARALISAIESRARELGCFRLEVATQPSRYAALSAYLALGFEERPHRLVKPLGR